jgi:hypothetical protein
MMRKKNILMVLSSNFCICSVSSALLRKMLVENPSKRATIAVIQNHQWYTKTYCKEMLGTYLNRLILTKQSNNFLNHVFNICLIREVNVPS